MSEQKNEELLPCMADSSKVFIFRSLAADGHITTMSEWLVLFKFRKNNLYVTLPGGKMEAGESFDDCMKRGLQEELLTEKLAILRNGAALFKRFVSIDSFGGIQMLAGWTSGPRIALYFSAALGDVYAREELWSYLWLPVDPVEARKVLDRIFGVDTKCIWLNSLREIVDIVNAHLDTSYSNL